MLRASISAADYCALASECCTQNQFNELHIHFERILAPSEFAELRHVSTERQFPDCGRTWLKNIESLSPGLFEAPKGFTRRAFTENILLYQDASRHAADKTLLIGHSGNARRLMLPISVFLQCLSSQAWDVVLLRKGRENRSYFEGLGEETGCFVELIRYVGTLVAARQYRRVVTLGTSTGGFPAILTALLMDAALAVSIGGALPRAPLEESLKRQLGMHRGSTSERPEISLVYGADFAPDREAALAIHAEYGGRLYPLPGVADHNALMALLSKGELTDFLETVLA